MVNPEGGLFPETMRPFEEPRNLTFNPENGEHSLMVSSPMPGDWYMLAFVNKKVFMDYTQQVIQKFPLKNVQFISKVGNLKFVI